MKNTKVTASAAAVSVLLGSQIAIGAAAIFAKYALVGAGPLMVSALRLTIAAALAALLSSGNKQAADAKVRPAHECLFAFCGLMFAINVATWIASLNMTSVAVSTLLVSTAPVWTTLYDCVVLKFKPSAMFWFGFLACAIGTIVVVIGGSQQASLASSPTQTLGAFLAAIGGLAFACYLIALRSVSNEYPMAVIVNRTYAWTSLFLWLGVVLCHESLPQPSITCWAGIIGMSLVSQLLGQTGMSFSLKVFPANTVALSTLLEPVLAAVLAWMIFAEVLSYATVFGALLLVAGLIAVLRAQIRKPEVLQPAAQRS